jgi:GAF domain-containing protein
VYDQPLLLQTLSRFARVLPSEYDIETALAELTSSVTAVLGLTGSGVTLATNGHLRFVTGVNDLVADLERLQEESQSGPCRDAYDTGEPVCVHDLRETGDRWGGFSAAAGRLGVAGAAGVPMRLADQVVGALNLYDDEPRDWPDDDVAVARLLADMATSYLVNASKLHQEQQLNEQLQHALTSRVVIEQAKGIIANDRSTTVEEAYQLIRRHARNNNARLGTVAEAIVHVGLRV